MGLFGEQCVRCGTKRIRREFEGLPTCTTCETEIRAEREEARPCPNDGEAMQKEIVLNVVIDRCPTCGGVWLDAGELNLIRMAANHEGLGSAFVLGMAPAF
ncbi:MAG TPA: zf-TFIIB domain-containing protein [Longimicrobiales bacterium]|nr:zf-TFIIB domain-containing protein [Longimicrobiales bacterium]